MRVYEKASGSRESAWLAADGGRRQRDVIPRYASPRLAGDAVRAADQMHGAIIAFAPENSARRREG